MLKLLTTNQFKRDLKRMKKRGKELAILWIIIEKLLDQERLDSSDICRNWNALRSLQRVNSFVSNEDVHTLSELALLWG
ncbi:MAG: hypothetical protein K1060chlam2_00312 [Chlamydiae bacterium]|nr:hypothetical protein [Chlamydiota bacterium]